MNPAKSKIDDLRSALSTISRDTRRQTIEDTVRPLIEALKSDWHLFTWQRDRYLSQIGTLETWATEIWKNTKFEMKVGKFLAELQKLEDRLKL